MRYAIVDIGSNTIRLNVYEIEDNEIRLLFSKKTVAGLSAYRENGRLSQKGIQKAAKILASYRQLSELLGVEEFLPFATASLREVDNANEALDDILHSAGVRIDLVEGAQEARYGYRGLCLRRAVDTGVMFDIGGGSTELIYFEKGEVAHAVSIPIGSLSSFSQQVKGLFPTKPEASDIRSAMNKRLDAAGVPKNKPHRVLYGIGGTVRACGNLAQDTLGLDSNRRVTHEQLRHLIKSMRNQDPFTLRTLLKITPERIHTQSTGMILMDALCQRFDAEEIAVTKSGVREGYLVDTLLKKGVIHDGFRLRQ